MGGGGDNSILYNNEEEDEEEHYNPQWFTFTEHLTEVYPDEGKIFRSFNTRRQTLRICTNKTKN